jgi:hypothetical protein
VSATSVVITWAIPVARIADSNTPIKIHALGFQRITLSSYPQ